METANHNRLDGEKAAYDGARDDQSLQSVTILFEVLMDGDNANKGIRNKRNLPIVYFSLPAVLT